MTRFRAGQATHVGQVRSVNQDSTLVGDDIFAVADGMGGHQGGEIASALAIETLSNSFSDPSTDALVHSVQKANEKILEKADDDPELTNMGTTMVVLAAVNSDNEDRLAIANVGDSRCYLLEDGKLRQLTKDHSMVQTLVDNGQITPAEADVHPQKNILTRALGIDSKVLTDSWELLPFAGDRYLLCSDGLFNEVSESVIGEVLNDTPNPSEAAEKLVQLANEGGGRDNISVVVVDIVDDGGRRNLANEAKDRVAVVVPGGKRAIKDATLEITPEEAQAARDEGTAGDATARTEVEGPEPLVDPDSVDDKPPEPPHRATASSANAIDTEPPKAPNAKFRGLLFGGIVAAILITAVVALGFAARSTYRVAFDLSETGSQELVIKEGGDILWFGASVHTRTGIDRSTVPQSFLRPIDSEVEFSTLADAEEYIDNLRAEISDRNLNPPTGNSPVLTTPTTPSTEPEEDPDDTVPDDSSDEGEDPGEETGEDPTSEDQPTTTDDNTAAGRR